MGVMYENAIYIILQTFHFDFSYLESYVQISALLDVNNQWKM